MIILISISTKKLENRYKRWIIKIFPGLLVSILIAYISILISKYISKLGASSISVFLGITLGNTLLNQKIFQDGYKFAETNLLSFSIVLLGGTLSISTILKLGVTGVSFIVLQMSLTIIAALVIGKKLGFNENFRYLMASGNAVCGSSAIAATASVIDAEEDDKGISIAIVNFTGVILMLLLPVISDIIYNHETLKTSAMIGGTIQSIGQVVASGALVSESVKDLSTIFKILRVILLVVVVMLLGNLKNRNISHNTSHTSKNNTLKKIGTKIPWYVSGFFITCLLFTFDIIPRNLSIAAKSLSSNLEIIALAAIGLKINFKKLIKQGKAVSIYGFLIGLIQITCAIVLINILY